MRNRADMGVSRFEDLRVWQAAKEQADRVGTLIKRPDFRDDEELTAQVNAASLSVMFNISEGFLRRRDRETGQFLRYAFGSNGEVKAGFYAAHGRSYITAEELKNYTAANDSIARMLRRWLSTLDAQDQVPNRKPPTAKKDDSRSRSGAGPRTKD
jgi:four helix bundle protein